MAKAILLVRTSTVRQEIDTQRKELVQLALADGYRQEDLIIIEGVGASAIKLNEIYLNEIQDLYNTIENDPSIKSVFAWELSRIGRNEVKLFEIKNFLIDHKVQLVIKNPSLRLLNNDGSVNNGVELAFSLFATMSKQEMEIKQQRFNRAKQRNKAEGKYNGGKIKLGYCLDSTNHFIIDEEKAKVVRDIFQWYVDGMSLKKINDKLVDMGIYSSLMNFATGGKRVGVLLKDKAYIGVGYHQIVDEDTFNKAQERMSNRHKWHSSKNLFFCKSLIKDTASNATLCSRSATLVYYVRHKVHTMSLNINAMDFIAMQSADVFMAQINADIAQKNTHTYDITIQENNALIMAKNRQIKDFESAIGRAIEMNIAQPKYYPKEKMEQTIKTNEKQIEILQKQIVDLETENQRMSNWLNGNQQFINTIYEYSDEKKFEIIQDVIERIEATEIEKHHFKIVVISKMKTQQIWDYSSQGHKLKIEWIMSGGNIDMTDKMNKNKRFERIRYNGK